MEKLNHAGFDDLNSMLGGLSAIEAGAKHGEKEQGLFGGIDTQDFCFAFEANFVCLKLVHSSKHLCINTFDVYKVCCMEHVTKQICSDNSNMHVLTCCRVCQAFG